MAKEDTVNPSILGVNQNIKGVNLEKAFGCWLLAFGYKLLLKAK